MAILKIARMGHPVLAQPARPVADPQSAEIRRLVEDMLETMIDAGGTGLAAPQVYVPLRVALFFVARERAAREDGGAEDYARTESGEELAVPLTILINPRWEPLDDEMVIGPEGCLSVPGLMGQVPRHKRIKYRGISPEGQEIVRDAEGFHARVVQHELDHLDGILYPQRMTDLGTLMFNSEVAAHYDENEALRRYRAT
ncbi:MAG: peptide deformylase [Kiloniellales bacterium]|nr:peptide deformylase [Kiloniellales bacterium]